MESFSTVMIIVGIIQLITLIVFFVMASNVASIKKMMRATSASSYINLAGEEAYLGNTSKAKEYYLRAKYKYDSDQEKYLDTNGIDRGKEVGMKIVDELIAKL